jgi:acyl-CoA synthetase (AMP-forming)/AMP-acid ligase II
MRTISHYVDLRAQEQPDAPYLIAPETGRTLTYAQLKRHGEELGRFLLGAGLSKGDKVALLLPNSYQAAQLFISVMYAGFWVCPLNLLAPASQLAYMMDHSDARLVFTSREHVQALRAALSEVKRELMVIVIDPDALSALDVEILPEATLPPIIDRDEAMLIYTSGTTGKPKGCVLTHRSVVAGGEFTSAAHGLTREDRVLCVMPLYHIAGQIVAAVAPLVHGGSVVMPHRFSVSGYWELVSRYRCTWIMLVPTMMAYLLNRADPRQKGLSLGQVKFCRSSSAPLPPHLHRAFEAKFGIDVIETFGMTETNAPCFTNPLDAAKRKIGSPGRAYGNEAKIIEPATGNTQPPGAAGEIMVRGDNVMKCYYKDPELTAQTLEPDGWMHTADVGYLDEDGYLFVTGRIKELIIKGGENIAPREIDEALLKHPAVLEAAAAGMPDTNYGQEILACVVLKAGHRCTVEELAAFSQRELGRYKAPKVIKLVESLPKGPSGKVQRLKLLEI